MTFFYFLVKLSTSFIEPQSQTSAMVAKAARDVTAAVATLAVVADEVAKNATPDTAVAIVTAAITVAALGP